MTEGLRGNSQFLLPNIRNGILIHTGEWDQHSDWVPGKPMPNSAGMSAILHHFHSPSL